MWLHVTSSVSQFAPWLTSGWDKVVPQWHESDWLLIYFLTEQYRETRLFTWLFVQWAWPGYFLTFIVSAPHLSPHGVWLSTGPDQSISRQSRCHVSTNFHLSISSCHLSNIYIDSFSKLSYYLVIIILKKIIYVIDDLFVIHLFIKSELGNSLTINAFPNSINEGQHYLLLAKGWWHMFFIVIKY